jgi:hypothetical protein
MQKHGITWYIHAKDGHTIEALGRVVGRENVSLDVPCDDGKSRDMYEQSFQQVMEADGQKENLHLKFSVWKRDGEGDAHRFDLKLFRDRPKKVRDAARELKEKLEHANRPRHS